MLQYSDSEYNGYFMTRNPIYLNEILATRLESYTAENKIYNFSMGGFAWLLTPAATFQISKKHDPPLWCLSGLELQQLSYFKIDDWTFQEKQILTALSDLWSYQVISH